MDKTITLENINVLDHTSFARGLIERHIISLKRKRDLLNRIESIENRIKDPLLYLAVIGEFDSGKSTFINGMLRQRLLKSSLVPTTASVTCITPGNKFIVKANFVDGTTINASEEDFKELENKIRKIKPDLGYDAIDLHYMLDLLTTEKSVADTVKRIDIEVPSDHLLSDVAIIDTPGINAGADYAVGHEEITQNVVDNVADAAIVLIPSSSPMTATLIHFLDTTARHFLHRCIFIVTAMDKQNEEERNHVIDFVKFELKDKLKLSNNIVLQSNAIAMIPIKNIPLSMQDSWEYWQNQFKQSEVIIRQKMIQQRGLIISEHLIRLLQELNKDLNIELKEKRKEYRKEEAILEQSSVESIEKVLGILYDQSAKKVAKEISAIKLYVNSEKNVFCSAAKAEVTNILNSNTGMDTKNYEIEIIPKIKFTVEKQGQTYLKNTEIKLKNLHKSCNDICNDFGSKFEASYNNLPFLGAKIIIPVLSVPAISIPAISVPEAHFSLSKDYVKEQVKGTFEELGKVGGGALVAGILIHLGFYGLIIILIIGAIIVGLKIYYDSSESQKEREEQLSSVNRDIDNFFAEYNKQIIINLGRMHNEILSQFKNSVSAHINEYRLKVNELIEKHKKEENRLEKEIDKINLDISELSARNKKLDYLKKVLLELEK